VKLVLWATKKEDWLSGMKRLDEKYPRLGFAREGESLRKLWSGEKEPEVTIKVKQKYQNPLTGEIEEW